MFDHLEDLASQFEADPDGPDYPGTVEEYDEMCEVEQ